MKTHEIYWLAGILDGEGSFTIDFRNERSKKYPSIRVNVGMTDEDTIFKLQEITGVGYISSSFLPSGKEIYQWQIAKQQDVAALIMTIYPLMSKRRKQRIEELLFIWRSYLPRRQRPCNKGHDMTGANLRITPDGHRRCRECEKIYRGKIAMDKFMGYR